MGMATRVSSLLSVLTAVASVAAVASGASSVLLAHRIAVATLLAGSLLVAFVSGGRVAWTVIGLQLLEGITGPFMKTSAWVALLHEIAAPVLVSATFLLAVRLSAADWLSDETVEDEGRPSLRTLARHTPIVIWMQIVLGGLFRNGIFSAIPHIAGAMLAGGWIMFAGIAILQSAGRIRPLRLTALALLTITFVQFLLGIYAYVSRIAASEGGSTPLLHAVTVSHISTGALTMGLSVILAFLVSRHVKPAAIPSASMAVSP